MLEQRGLEFLEDPSEPCWIATASSFARPGGLGELRYAVALPTTWTTFKAAEPHHQGQEEVLHPDQILVVLGVRVALQQHRRRSPPRGSRGVSWSSFHLLTTNYDLAKLSAELKSLRERGWGIGPRETSGRTTPRGWQRKSRGFRARPGVRPEGPGGNTSQFEFGTTWEIMERAGFVYDTTVGNRDKLGFRLGLCTPFHPPDRDWRPMKVLELPLVVMDTTLWGYLGRDEEQGRGDLSAMRDKVAQVEAAVHRSLAPGGREDDRWEALPLAAGPSSSVTGVSSDPARQSQTGGAPGGDRCVCRRKNTPWRGRLRASS